VPSLADIAHRALALVGHEDGRWLDFLRGIDGASVEEVVRSTPKMSDPARRFVVGLLDLNRRRLLGDID